MRSVEEWHGKTDDTAIPARVKLRIFDRFGGCCATCTRRIGGSLLPAYDHTISLIAGGENRESNLQLLCETCHSGKTKLDVRIKSKIARVRQRHLGIKKRGRTIGGRRFDGTPIFPRWR